MKRRTKPPSLRPNATLLFWLGVIFYAVVVLPKLVA
jgi:hypothetical protein